jgi:hypothetical protein
MKAAVKFSLLPVPEKRLLLKAAFLLYAVRLGLWLLPFQLFRRLLAARKRAAVRQQTTDHAAVERIVYLIRAASRFVPAATCLTQAITSLVLLQQLGYPARLRIGVAKAQQGPLEAHAWVESEGRIIIGRVPNLGRFSVLSRPQEEIL